MKKVVIVLLILTVMLSLSSLNVFVGNVFAGNGTLTEEKALKELQSVNPNIANYNIKTHLVTFRDHSKPIYVTPKGEHPQNGEVTWDYFIKQKGNLRGWFKLTPKQMLSEKLRIMYRNGLLKTQSIVPESINYPNSGYVSLDQFPQERCAWCGVAATESVLSGWSEYYPSQSDIAGREYGYDGTPIPARCDCSSSAYGVSENAIAYALNGYIFNQWNSSYWYKISHFNTIQEFLNILGTDIGMLHAGVIFCGYTEHLPAWNHHHAVHYTAVYAYNIGYSTVSYTDSANGLYKYYGIKESQDANGNVVNYMTLPEYNTCSINGSAENSYYQYAYPYPAVG